MNINTCVNCGSVDFYDYLRLENFEYKRCKKCRLVQLVPMPSPETLIEFYGKKYFDEKKYSNPNTERKKIIKQHTIEKYKTIKKYTNINTNSKFLDFGCGMGHFLDFLKEQGISNTYGYDLSNYSKEKLRLKNHNWINDFKNHENYFDIISLWDVAEHLTDPVRTLRLISGLLKPEGVLFVGTTRIDDIVDKTGLGYTMWVDPPAHTVLFSKKTIFSVLNKAGFDQLTINLSHRINNIYRSPKIFTKRLLKKIVFYYRTDRVNKQDTFGSYNMIIAKK